MSARGFTLAELMISLVLISIVMAAVGSTMVLTTRAMPTGTSPSERVIDASSVLADLGEDLETALHLTERRAGAVAFFLADRDGDGGPEWIRYAWSGTPGDPLTRQYGNADPVTVLEHAEEFSLTYVRSQRARAARILLVVPGAGSLGTQDYEKQKAMQNLGYPVQPISAAASQASYDLALATADVAYVSEEILSSDLGAKLRERAVGVLNEESSLNDEFGMCSSYTIFPDDRIDVTDNTHEITAALGLGALTICASIQDLRGAGGAIAPGLRTLAERRLSVTPVLAVIETGGALYDGGTAAGRRVLLPWGGDSFNTFALADNGLSLLRECIEWAAGPSVLSGVRIVLRDSGDPGTRLESEVRLVNQPGVAGP